MRGIDLLEDIGYLEDSLVQEAAINLQSNTRERRVNWVKWSRWGSLAATFVVLCVAAVVIRQEFGDKAASESATAYDTSSVLQTEDKVVTDTASSTTTTTTDSAKLEAYPADEIPKKEAQEQAAEEVKEEAAMVEEAEKEVISDYSQLIEDAKQEIGAVPEMEICYASPEKGEYFYFYELEAAMKEYEGQDVQYYVTIDVFGDCADDNGEKSYQQLVFEVLEGGDEVYDENSPLIKEYERLLGEGYQVIIEDDELRGYFTAEELNSFRVNPEYGYAFRFTEDF